MSYTQSENQSHVGEDEAGSSSSSSSKDQPRVRLQPILPERQYDHDMDDGDCLPPISECISHTYQTESSSPAAHVDNSLHEPQHTFREQPLQVLEIAVTSLRDSSVPSIVDPRVDQQWLTSYLHGQSSQISHSSSNAADDAAQQTQYHFQSLEIAGSSTVCPTQLVQQSSPRYSSCSPGTPAPQDSQSYSAVVHQAQFTAINKSFISSECAEDCRCSKCEAAITETETDDVQHHSVTSETRNKSQLGPCRKGGSRTRGKERRRRASKKTPKGTRTKLPSSQPRSTANRSSHPTTLRPAPSQSERTRIFNARLAAVNGVVSPSKLPPGVSPKKPKSHATAGLPLIMSCPRCTADFAKKDHLRSHFAPCIRRNGNPDGARWEEGVPPDYRAPTVKATLVETFDVEEEGTPER